MPRFVEGVRADAEPASCGAGRDVGPGLRGGPGAIPSWEILPRGPVSVPISRAPLCAWHGACPAERVPSTFSATLGGEPCYPVFQRRHPRLREASAGPGPSEGSQGSDLSFLSRRPEIWSPIDASLSLKNRGLQRPLGDPHKR